MKPSMSSSHQSDETQYGIQDVGVQGGSGLAHGAPRVNVAEIATSLRSSQ